MNVTETLSEGLKRGFTVTVPSADIEERRTAKLSEIGRGLNLPGFRPGKVPQAVVRQRFGRAVMAEVLEDSVNQAAEQVLADRGLRAAIQPKVDVKTLPDGAEAGKDLEFTLDVELIPDFTLPDFSAIKLTKLTAEPEEEALDKALAQLGEMRKTFEPVEGRAAVAGETLTVDYTGRIDGEAFPGGSAQDADIEVAGPNFIPGFTEQLVGLAPGETRVIDVTFPEDYGSQALAGKAAQFEIVAKALKVAKVPELDEAFAETLGFETLAEVRDVLKRQMQRELDQMSRIRLKRDLLDVLAKETAFEVPPTLLDGEFGQIWARVEADMKAGKLEGEDVGKDEATLKADYRAIAERRVRLGLLLSEVGRREGLSVSSDEMARAARTEAARYQGQEAQALKFFNENPQAMAQLRAPILEEKVVDYILDQATLEERKVTAEELAAEPEDGKAEAAA